MSVSFRHVVAMVLAVALAITLMPSAAVAAPAFRSKPLETKPNPDVLLHGSGWGHGVGMSQYGAYAQAQAGWGYGRILKHYYTGIGIGSYPMPDMIRVGLHPGMSLSNVDAVTGPIVWKALVDGKWQTKKQPKGTRWTVQLLTSGEFRLKEGSTRVWLKKTTLLRAVFNWAAKADGTIIEAYNPNSGTGNRSEYKWGRLEYTPRSVWGGTMNLVLEIPSMELYLRGLAEMPAGWGTSGGMAALKAQAIVGRAYATHLHSQGLKDCRCHILATPANQHYIGYDHERYGAPWVDAVNATRGIVATYAGKPIEAFYSSSHGGRSENIEDSWAYSASYAYVRSVDDPWSLRAGNGNPNTAWAFPVTNGSFATFAGGLRQVRRVKVTGARTDGGTPKTIRVWGIDSNGAPAVVDRTGRKGIVGVSLSDTYRPAGLKSQQIRRFAFAPFTDDDATPHEYANLFAYNAGIMNDVSVPQFHPDRNVLRGRAALYMYRLLKLPEPTKNYYDDIASRPGGERKAINALAEAGISGGLGKRKFRPTDVLTRAQAAVFFRNALGMSTKDTNIDYFTDDDGMKAEPAINRMRKNELMGRCAPNRFCPGRAMKRGTMATLLHTTIEAYR